MLLQLGVEAKVSTKHASSFSFPSKQTNLEVNSKLIEVKFSYLVYKLRQACHP